MRRCLVALATTLAALGLTSSLASATTSHEGWPTINGMLLMNKLDQDRPLDARVGQDPFDGQDEEYRCDGLHLSQQCFVGEATCELATVPQESRKRRTGPCVTRTVRATKHHNELLGAHGDDEIHAGANGDVLWGDYKEDSGQPTDQHDRLFGGPGRDFIYASHGRNEIDAGGGNDYVKAHFGRGTIDCGQGTDVLYISRKAQRHYTIHGCERVSHKTLGY
jgi:Ca2+-binding RTX toxin-like protein